jgi:hypothetical protein
MLAGSFGVAKKTFHTTIAATITTTMITMRRMLELRGLLSSGGGALVVRGTIVPEPDPD